MVALDPFPQDPSLGLRQVGALAFKGFWFFAAAIVPSLVPGAGAIQEWPFDERTLTTLCSS